MNHGIGERHFHPHSNFFLYLLTLNDPLYLTCINIIIKSTGVYLLTAFIPMHILFFIFGISCVSNAVKIKPCATPGQSLSFLKYPLLLLCGLCSSNLMILMALKNLSFLSVFSITFLAESIQGVLAPDQKSTDLLKSLKTFLSYLSLDINLIAREINNLGSNDFYQANEFLIDQLEQVEIVELPKNTSMIFSEYHLADIPMATIIHDPKRTPEIYAHPIRAY